MRNPQPFSLLLLFVAVILFFFSLSLLPPVEMYCRFRHAAMGLLALQVLLFVVRIRLPRFPSDSALAFATFVFAPLGIVFNVALLVMARGRC
jgi:hypothetical protein